MISESAIEAAARAICRRRLLLNQERGQLPPLGEAMLQDAVNASWSDFEGDARVALEAADRNTTAAEPCNGDGLSGSDIVRGDRHT